MDTKDIKIYQVKEVIDKDIEYDDERCKHYLCIYSKVTDIKLGLKLDNMIIDLKTMKEFNFVIDNLNIGDTFIDSKALYKFKDISNLKGNKEDIIRWFENFKKENYINKYINHVSKREYYVNRIPYNLKDKVMVDYYNDHDDEYYYDEYKEYRKDRILYTK